MKDKPWRKGLSESDGRLDETSTKILQEQEVKRIRQKRRRGARPPGSERFVDSERSLSNGRRGPSQKEDKP